MFDELKLFQLVGLFKIFYFCYLIYLSIYSPPNSFYSCQTAKKTCLQFNRDKTEIIQIFNNNARLQLSSHLESWA